MKKFLLPILCLFISYSVFSQISFVKDISTGTNTLSSSPESFVDLGDKVYFIAQHDIYGSEIWVSDGTSEGTVLLLDINPGSNSGASGKIVKMDNILYFAGNDGENGIELWRSDGTVSGTYMVIDINPGPKGSFPNGFKVINNKLVFRAQSENEGIELWISDGTEEGTKIVDIWPGKESSYPDFNSVPKTDSVLYFNAQNETEGREIWRTNGTVSGTYVVTNLTSEPSAWSYPYPIGTINNKLIFFFDSTGYGSEIWVSDETPEGTKMLKDINVGPDGSWPGSHGNGVYNDFFYFYADDGINGKELWRTDGDTTTELVADIYPGGSSSPRNFYPWNGKLYFTATNVDGNELWMTDGTTTQMVKDINPGSASSQPRDFAGGDTLLFFRANDGVHGDELWATNGTETGTRMVKDINVGASGSGPNNLFFYNGLIYMSAVIEFVNFERELWISGGDASSTQLLKNINDAKFSSNPSYLTGLNGKLIFNAKNNANDNELWISEGTEASTVLLKDINPGTTGSTPKNFFVSDNVAFFAANDGSNGNELWKTDGTSGNTQLYADIYPGGPAGSDPKEFCQLNDLILFSANGGFPSIGTELHVINASGDVELVRDIYTGDYNSGNPSELTRVNDQIFFSGTFSGDRELGITDGTSVGTKMVKDINPSGHSFPKNLTEFNSLLFFTANDGTNGKELWVSDGSSVGTNMFIDLYSGGSSSPSNLVVAGDKLFFKAYNETSGDSALYVTDGTVPGTEVLIQYNSETTRIRNITVLRDQIYFNMKTDSVGAELWISDGTVAGTKLLKDICSGTCNSSPNTLYTANHILFFNAYDPTYGLSLWTTDGTTDNTVRIPTQGDEKIEITEFEMVDSILYFSAKEIGTGQELWKYTCTPPSFTNLENDSVCAGENAVFTVITDTNTNIRWQLYTGTAFEDITNGGKYTIRHDTLLIDSATEDMSGNIYRCIIESSCFVPSITNAVTLFVKSPGNIAMQPVDINTCFNESVEFDFGVTGTEISLQWQIDTGSGFVEITDGINYTGSASNKLSVVSARYNMNNYQYRCKIEDVCSPTMFTDTVKINVDSVVFVEQPQDTTVCNGEPFNFSVNVSGEGISYQWQRSTDGGSSFSNLLNNPTYSGVQTSQLNISAASVAISDNIYKCIVDANCQSALSTDEVQVHLFPDPVSVIEQNKDLYSCFDDTVTLTTSLDYVSYLWSNDSTSESILVHLPGTYTVTITDTNNCEGISSEFTVSEKNISTPEICILTIDMETGKNLIAWERLQEPGIAGYKIYRESSLGGSYDSIGTMPFDSVSVFVDYESRPETKSYSYKISAFDACGYETPLSLYHKTMLLTSNIGPSSINLSWQEYEVEGGGFGFVRYRIFRGTDSSALTQIDSVLSNNVMYPDFDAPKDVNVYYRIAGVRAEPCVPLNVGSSFKASSGPFSQSLSNIEDNRLREEDVSINVVTGSITNLNAYPNPFKQVLQIEYTINSPGKVLLAIYNMYGKKESILDTGMKEAGTYTITHKTETPGVYMIRLQKDDDIVTKKVVGL